MKALAIAMVSVLLGACAGRGVNVGMTTSLEPGETLTIKARGGTPVARVVNHGPGELSLSHEGTDHAAATLGSRGSTEVAVAGTVRVKNTSSERATVDVGVTGADHADIRGPVVGGK